MPYSGCTRLLWSSLLVLLVGAVLFECLPQARAAQNPSPDPRSQSRSLPTLGVVWTPPASPDSAARELTRIHHTGATAVRLTRLPTDTVAARADTLGLHLYVDLPVEAVPAFRLADTLSQAALTWDRLFSLAAQHSSITHVGLARSVDTTVPEACDVLARWTNRVHDRAPSLRTYYVTPFTPTVDQCADAVDRPLLDLRGHPHPVDRWRRWHAQTDAVGLGAIGTWVDPEATSGLRVPNSAHRQARYLETTLAQLLDTTRTAPPVVFVDRWRDDASPLLPSRHFGLYEANGTARPAARVVRGMYSGTQRAFAFPRGSPPSASYALVLLGWGLVALLGLAYTGSLFVRQTVVRYFTAPGFYRDALRDGRDLSPWTNGLVLGIVAASFGVATSRAAQLASAHPDTIHVLAALPRSLQAVLAQGIEHPVLAGLVAGGGGLGILCLWMGGLVLAARIDSRFSLAQGVVLVTWPCWPVLVALPVALATGPAAPLSPRLFTLVLLGGGGFALVSVSLRVLHDFWRTTEAPAWTLPPLFAISPLALVGTALLIAGQVGVPFRFLWRLVVYT